MFRFKENRKIRGEGEERPKSAEKKEMRADVRFEKLCNDVNEFFERELHEPDEIMNAASILKRAIIGEDTAVNEVKSKIRAYLIKYDKESEWHPPWYGNLVDGIFHENWGLTGLAEWWNEKFKSSSSAKIIGNRIYFLEKGEKVLQMQRISDERRNQLIRAFLAGTPEERMDKDSHEIYMRDGTRVTVFKEIEGSIGIAKKSVEAIMLRRYVIPKYSFEEQSERGTISSEMIPLLKLMVKLGYNMIFAGAVGTAKTTFLTTWLSYEDPTLEGTMVETDPEIPLHKILPNAPIIQIVADDAKLSGIAKNLMRSDSDYFVMAEARNGVAIDVAVTIANRGTRRVKMTFHCKAVEDICYDMAYEIMKSVGGDIKNNEIKVAKSFDYVIHMRQLKDKSQKRLNAIYALDYDRKSKEIIIEKICGYDSKKDAWAFHRHISKDKEREGREEDEKAFEEFQEVLAELAEKYPMTEDDGDE